MTHAATTLQAYVDALANEVRQSIAFTELAIVGLRAYAAEVASLPTMPSNPDPLISVGKGDPNLGTPAHGAVRRSVLVEYAKQGTGEVAVALSQQWLLAVYARWELENRKAIAPLMGVPDENYVYSDLFGDLRLLRNDVAHNGGRVQASTASKMKVLSHFAAGDVVRFDAEHCVTIGSNVAVYPKP